MPGRVARRCRLLFWIADTHFITAGSEPDQKRTWMEAPIVEVARTGSGAVKPYSLSSVEVISVDHLSLEIATGEFVAVVVRLGSGKTTLLNLLAGIDRPT